MGHFQFKDLKFAGAKKIMPFQAFDRRGELIKVFSSEEYRENGIVFSPFEEAFVHSKKGTLRGIHYQKYIPQPKLLRLISGYAWTVLVDIDKKSPSYQQWIEVDINDRTTLYIPGMCALGTLALKDTVMHIMYGEKFIDEYSAGIRWNDKTLSVNWPLDKIGGTPIVSDKDRMLGEIPYPSQTKILNKILT